MTSLRLGIAGLGTVGGEVARLIQANAAEYEKRAGKKISITAISARDKTKKRSFDTAGMTWVDNPVELAARSDVDAVLELMGGAEGAAKELAEATLKAGKPFITANKALLAHHGAALSKLARTSGAPIYFEASVTGAIPAVKTLREALAGDTVKEICGILNGTCNYILTTMRETGRAFDDILKDAQKLGYAEADPSFDVDGIDAAHKLAILSSLAFEAPLNISSLAACGIRSITPQDIKFADELGCRIKLLGVARLTNDGLQQHVSPYLVPLASMLAHVEGVTNAVLIKSEAAGPLALMGSGAGAGPTASAVLSDIMDCACLRRGPLFAAHVAKLDMLAPEKNMGEFYLRIQLQDRPGVLADITGILRDEKISIQSVIQHGHTDVVSSVFVTHEVSEKALCNALAALKKLPTVLESPCVIRLLP
jgi:homoserine dehydrogenase